MSKKSVIYLIYTFVLTYSVWGELASLQNEGSVTLQSPIGFSCFF